MHSSENQTRRAAWGGIAVAAAVLCSVGGRAESQAPLRQGSGGQAPVTTDAVSHAALVEKSCLSCHNDKSKTAGLSLQGLSLTDVPAHAEIWEKVLRKVKSGDMPPVTARVRPEPADAAGFCRISRNDDRPSRARSDQTRDVRLFIGSTAPNTATRFATCWQSM